MEYLKIRNWDRWQSYRSDRGLPPWIKVHRQILRNAEWVKLTDAQRGQLLTMWILAADKAGEIPSDPNVLKILCHMESEPDLDLFIVLGFIEATPGWRQHDVNVTPTCGIGDASDEGQMKGSEGKVREGSPVPVDDVPDRPEAERLCRILRDGILDNRPNAKVPTPGDPGWTRWVADMDLMLRRDGRTEDEATAVIRWAAADDFWKSNILSPSKLRKQYDRLALQMRRPATGGRKDHTADTKAALDGALRIMRGGK